MSLAVFKYLVKRCSDTVVLFGYVAVLIYWSVRVLDRFSERQTTPLIVSHLHSCIFRTFFHIYGCHSTGYVKAKTEMVISNSPCCYEYF